MVGVRIGMVVAVGVIMEVIVVMIVRMDMRGAPPLPWGESVAGGDG